MEEGHSPAHFSVHPISGVICKQISIHVCSSCLYIKMSSFIEFFNFFLLGVQWRPILMTGFLDLVLMANLKTMKRDVADE